MKKTEELCKDTFTDKKGLGVLSKNNMQNLKYHFVITIALIARYCIDGGMDVSTSYALSDFYIQKADESLIALGYTEHSFAHVGMVAAGCKPRLHARLRHTPAPLIRCCL